MLKPVDSGNSLKHSDEYWGPLSDIMSSGMPYRENIDDKWLITQLEVVCVSLAISIHRE